jgi:hypothetical protein
MIPRCPEHVAAGLGYARCHRPPGHPPPCHAAGRTWYPAGDAGQRVRIAVPCFPDCLPIPGPPPRRPAKTTARTRRTANR